MDFETLVPTNLGGGGGSTYTEAVNFAALPDPTLVTPGEVRLVQTSTGIWPIRKYAGLWRSNGVAWVYLGNYDWVAEEIGYTAGGSIVATTVSGAIAELDTEKATPGFVSTSISTAITTHEGLSDPHPNYLTQTEGDARYQLLSSIAEVIDDRVAALLVAGTNMTLTYNDGAGTLTLDAAGGGGGYTDEQVRDVMGTALVAGTGVTLTVDDGGDTITVDASGGGGSDPWSYATLPSDVTNSTLTPVDATGLTFTAAPNKKYLVQVFGAGQSVAGTTGIALQLNIPDGTIIGQMIAAISALTVGGIEQVADDATPGVGTASVRAVNTNFPVQYWAIYNSGATGGTVTLRLKSEINTSQVTLKANLTVMQWRELP